MHLPLSSPLEVGQDKILNYLLSPEHPDGKSKAAFFIGFGFSRADGTSLRKRC